MWIHKFKGLELGVGSPNKHNKRTWIHRISQIFSPHSRSHHLRSHPLPSQLLLSPVWSPWPQPPAGLHQFRQILLGEGRVQHHLAAQILSDLVSFWRRRIMKTILPTSSSSRMNGFSYIVFLHGFSRRDLSAAPTHAPARPCRFCHPSNELQTMRCTSW